MPPQSTLLDRSICPDCRAPLDLAGTCTGCGLRLVGPLAVRLYDTLVVADRLIGALRTEVVAPAPRPTSAALPTYPVATPRPAAARAATSRPTVPVVLLGLGTLCLLVAAVVFAAVAWGALGLGGRSAVLGGVTLLLGAAAATLTRRRLWLGAGAVWTLVHLVLAVDLLAARAADLLGLGDVPGRHVVAALGGAWVVLGLAVARSSRPLGRAPVPATVFTVAGSALVAGAGAWTAEHRLVATVVTVGVLGVGAAALWRSVRGVAAGLVALAAVSWLLVLGDALGRLAGATGDAGWWRHGTGWPLLVLAGYAAVATRLRLPGAVRSVAAGVSLVLLCLLAAGPSTTATADRLTAVGLTLALAAAAAAGPPVWAVAGALLGAVGGVGLTVDLATRPLPVVGRLPSWGGHPVDLVLAGGGAGPWTALVVAAALPLVALGLGRHLPHGLAAAARPAVAAATPVLVAAGLMTTVLLSAPTVLVATITCAAATTVGILCTFAVRRAATSAAVTLTIATWPALHLLRVSAPSHLLAATVATGLAVLLAAVVRASKGSGGGAVAAVPTTLLAGYAALRWTALAGGSERAEALVLALAAAAAVLTASSLRAGEPTRVAVELTTIPLAVVALGLATDLTGGAAATVAMVLTILGTAVCLVAVRHTDRTDLSWVGAALLGVATLVRVTEQVAVPERWTLPAAATLLVAGGWRLRTDPRATSTRMLGSGLTLALLPSLLLALDEPLGDRGVLVAVAGLVALAVGVGQRWAAPFAAGAVVTATLAVRHLGPVADALPRWISLGAVGAVLLAVGVTWESRRRNLAAADHYLAGLR